MQSHCVSTAQRTEDQGSFNTPFKLQVLMWCDKKHQTQGSWPAGFNFCLVPTLRGAAEAPPGAAAFCRKAVTRGLNKLLLASGVLCLPAHSQSNAFCPAALALRCYWRPLVCQVITHQHISASEPIHSQVWWGWTFTSRVLEPLPEFLITLTIIQNLRFFSPH